MQVPATQPVGLLSEKKIDLLAAAVLLIFMSGWHWRVTGGLTTGAAATLLLLVALCLAYGSLFQRVIAPLFQRPAGLPFRFTAGYLVFNSLLFIVALLSPLGMAWNLVILSVAAGAGLFAMRKKPLAMPDRGTTPQASWAALAAVLIACTGASIWSGDAQAPLQVHGASTIFQVWSDAFIHAREISVFADAHGISTVQDIKLAGGRAPIYHFASYLTPAAMSVLSGASAMQVYASLQLPLGIALTGMAAFCLMSTLFGAWPGVAAVVAVVLVPDAYQQGFQNRYLSYHFMSQVNLGMLYGIACVALAWMFMLDGCRRGRIGPVLLAYGFLALCLFYKAHLFVANSYILMMFPFVLFKPVPRSWRIVSGLLATLCFCLVIYWSQSNPRVPVLRLDGSGIGRYLLQLLHDYEPGWMKPLFQRLLVQEKHSFALQTVYAAALLSLSTFGIWLAGLAVALVKTRRTMPLLFWLFPVIVLGNYLVMAMGLALDSHGVGSPDELLNRPLVWAYFAIAAWTAAVGYRVLIGESLPRGRPATVATLVLLTCFGATLYSAPNLQTFPGHVGKASFVESGAIPTCLVQTADYLRRQSEPGDVIQDAGGDPSFVLTALSERQLYVGNTAFGGQSPIYRQRLADIKLLGNIGDSEQLHQFFNTHEIAWFVQTPDASLAWPPSVLNQPVFVCGGYRLFHFVRGAAGSASALTVAAPGSAAPRALH